MIIFLQIHQINEADQEDTTVLTAMSELSSDEQRTVRRIEQMVGVVNIVGRDWEDFLVIEIPERYAESKSIYNLLFVSHNGDVAEAGLNQPQFFQGLGTLQLNRAVELASA